MAEHRSPKPVVAGSRPVSPAMIIFEEKNAEDREISWSGKSRDEKSSLAFQRRAHKLHGRCY